MGLSSLSPSSERLDCQGPLVKPTSQARQQRAPIRDEKVGALAELDFACLEHFNTRGKRKGSHLAEGDKEPGDPLSEECQLAFNGQSIWPVSSSEANTETAAIP